MEDLFLYLVKSCGLLVVFLAFYHILLKKDTSFKNNRGFLLGGIIASAVLPAVYFTRKIVIETIEPNFSMAEADLPVAQILAEEPAISGYQIFATIYLCGVVFMLGRLMLQLISLQRIISKGKLTKKDGFKYVLISQKIAPFSFLNYIVYNPNLHSASERENILKHEKIHVTHWHTTDVFLAHLNQIYQWFNPFAWIYLKSLQQNLEYIADSEAVKEVSCKKEYQKALLKISVESLNPALTNSFYQSFIKKRILMLNNSSNSKNQIWKTAIIFPVLFAFLVLFNVKTEAQIKTQTESTETTNNRMAATITKESEESSLKYIKRFFGKQDIQLDFENIQRSGDGFITGISVNFLNKNNNASGNYTKNNPDGINSFEIYMQDGETGFADVSTQEKSQKTTQEVLNQLGEDPLYIVDGKEYAAGELEGKSIEITDGFIFLNSKNLTKYGDRGKDGVIMISKGKIINDISEEMRSIDQENAPVKKSFIQIRKGEKPMFMEVTKTPASKLQSQKSNFSVKTDSTSRSGALGLEKIKGNPIYILNGKVVEKNKVDVEPNNIENITVLKGEKAVSLYGNAARDGAILITTKTSGFASEVSSVKFYAEGKEEIIALYNELKSEKKKALIILNGKKQPENFELNSIDPDDIEAINVQTGKDIITKYGKAAKDGVIFISTEKALKTGAATGNKIPTNIDITENSKFSKSDDKVITITADTDRINASQWGTRSNPANVIYFPQEEKPLVVIDGKEKEADFDMKSINPEDIESVNVLKGENAIKKYGVKAKNGVIEIDLKDKKEN